jgi:hypothetical protein
MYLPHVDTPPSRIRAHANVGAQVERHSPHHHIPRHVDEMYTPFRFSTNFDKEMKNLERSVSQVFFRNLLERVTPSDMQRIMGSFGELGEENLDTDDFRTKESLGTACYVRYLSVEPANFRYIDIEEARNAVKWLNGFNSPRIATQS